MVQQLTEHPDVRAKLAAEIAAKSPAERCRSRR